MDLFEKVSSEPTAAVTEQVPVSEEADKVLDI
jgi:hypothetical protein